MNEKRQDDEFIKTIDELLDLHLKDAANATDYAFNEIKRLFEESFKETVWKDKENK